MMGRSITEDILSFFGLVLGFVSLFLTVFILVFLPDQFLIGFNNMNFEVSKWFFVVPIILLVGLGLIWFPYSEKIESGIRLGGLLFVTILEIVYTIAIVRIVRSFFIPALPFEEQWSNLVLPFSVSGVLGVCFGFIFARIFKKLGLIDRPHGPFANVRPVPKVGALPVFFAVFIPLFIFYPNYQDLMPIFLGSLLLLIIQTVDDIKPLPPIIQGLGHIAGGLVLVFFGVGAHFINNPFYPVFGGEHMRFDSLKVEIMGADIYPLVFAITVAWVFLFINVFNWLDGIDGLAAGIGVIASLTIVLLSFMVGTPNTALISTVVAGALLGFLVLNFYPALIFLGGGAHVIGFLIASVAIISGAKTGTALLVLSIPIIDSVYVVLNRIKRKQSPFVGDKTHLWHRLEAAGLSHPQVVLVLWGVVGVFALLALLLRGGAKVIAFGFAVLATILINYLYIKKSILKILPQGKTSKQ